MYCSDSFDAYYQLLAIKWHRAVHFYSSKPNMVDGNGQRLCRLKLVNLPKIFQTATTFKPGSGV